MSETKNWHAEETYKSLILFGNTGLRFVLLVNGGAILALLTFVGNLQGKVNPAPDMTWPFVMFLTGILFGGFATLTAYFTQLTLYNESIGNVTNNESRNHTFWLRRSLALIGLGIVSFGIGSLLAVSRLG